MRREPALLRTQDSALRTPNERPAPAAATRTPTHVSHLLRNCTMRGEGCEAESERMSLALERADRACAILKFVCGLAGFNELAAVFDEGVDQACKLVGCCDDGACGA